MATVTGVTAQRADEIENKSIVKATKNGRNLNLETKGGTILSIENAFPAPFEMYPVGTFYYTDRPDNPALYMGGGTWQRVARGQVLVGVNEDDIDFDTFGKTGGAKSHTLTISEMPTHAHGGATLTESQAHSHSITIDPGGAHTHQYSRPKPEDKISGGGTQVVGDNFFDVVNTSSSGVHSHTATIGSQSANHTHEINAEGGGLPHNNLQPYMAVYIWKRTA